MHAILAAILAALAALPLSAVAAAHVYVVSSLHGNMGRFDAQTGTGGLVIPSGGGVHVDAALVGPDGNLYVSGNDTITRRDPVSGALLSTFGPSPTSSVNSPAHLTAIAFGPDGYLYVTDSWNGSIVRYDIAAELPIGVFVPSSDLGLDPHGLAFTPDGTSLLVSSDLLNRIRRYNAATGAAEGFFGPDDGLSSEQIAFGPDGNMYVPSRGNNNIRRYDAAGTYLGVFASGGGISEPFGLAFGPDGYLYASSGGDDRIYVYDIATGGIVRSFAATGMDLGFATYLAVAAPVPEPATYLLLSVALALIAWRTGMGRAPPAAQGCFKIAIRSRNPCSRVNS